MKVVILAAGYGTRLEKDLKGESGKDYRHLIGVPKPLLPIGGKPLASIWMENLHSCCSDDMIDEVFVVTNNHFLNKFQSWAADWPVVKVLNDGTSTNESRLGAVGDIQFCIQEFQIDDDLLIIGGDTLFYPDFKLKEVLETFYQRKETQKTGGQVLCYKCKDLETTKFGILELNEERRVTAFLEKPDPESTSSRWACPCFYIISKSCVPLVGSFLDEKQGSPLKEKDAPGNFIRYLQSRQPVYVVEISGRFDVGGLQSYIECNDHFIAG